MHALRHTNAQLREETGDDVRLIADALGHESPHYTGRYLKRMRGEEDPGSARVAALLGLVA